MSIRFSGGDRFQRGRGIGGLLRLAKNLFKPIVRTVGKAVKSNTGRAIGNALKEQAIETGTNLLTDVIVGNDLNQGLNREVNNIKVRTAEGIQQIKNSRKKPVKKAPSKKKKNIKKRSEYVG